jgi:hypothetical protein
MEEQKKADEKEKMTPIVPFLVFTNYSGASLRRSKLESIQQSIQHRILSDMLIH